MVDKMKIEPAMMFLFMENIPHHPQKKAANLSLFSYNNNDNNNDNDNDNDNDNSNDNDNDNDNDNNFIYQHIT